jgi:hypothetical protein
MDNEKMHEHVNDAIASDKFSNCCSAKVYQIGDDAICGGCEEHCEAVDEE